MDEKARNLEVQENNYKLYYQRINEKQTNLQQVFDQNIGQTWRSKDGHIQDFINKGIEEAQRKAAEEEALRQMRKQEQIKSMKESIQFKIQEHEGNQLRQKLGYKEKVEELMKQNNQMFEYNEQTKKIKTNQSTDYKLTLQLQMKEAEEKRRKLNSDMLDHEKKMLLNQFEGLVPGIRSTKVDDLAFPQMKSSRNMNYSKPEIVTSMNGSNVFSSGLYTTRGQEERNSPYQLSKEQLKPLNAILTERQEFYNTITNPIPKNNQNPYLAKELQRGNYTSRNVLATTADKNLLSMRS